MTWTKKRVLIVTKAYPEKSKKHGTVACTAGITEDGSWIRLYPIDIRHFSGKSKISKFDIIELECKPVLDNLRRRESCKVRRDSIKILDKSLTKPKVDWARRNKLILPNLGKSIENLIENYETDRISLGLIKPVKIFDFIKTEKLEIHEKSSWSFTENFDGQAIPKVVEIPHIFKYNFKCKDCKDTTHNMQCEDWELFESYRSWGRRYKDVDVLWKKLKGRYYNWMLKTRDLYFIMGMYSRYPTWFIIGLYYPPKFSSP